MSFPENGYTPTSVEYYFNYQDADNNVYSASANVVITFNDMPDPTTGGRLNTHMSDAIDAAMLSMRSQLNVAFPENEHNQWAGRSVRGVAHETWPPTTP